VANPENIIPHQFQKGTSGNPAGKPEGIRNTKTIRKELLQKTEKGVLNPLTGELDVLTFGERIVYAQAKKAIEGDLGATKFLVEVEEGGASDSAEQGAQNSPETLLDFIPHWNKRYVAPKHLKPLTNALERIAKGESVFLCISVPPRHGKKETLLNFIPYFIQRHSEKTVVYCSYAQRQSESKTLKSQGLIKQIGLSVSDTMANREEFRLASGGGILTTGVGGALTGQGADVLLIDDPIKNREEAESPVMRDKVWGWFEDVAETRLEPNSSVIVCMTRWHSDDLIGRILANRKEYEYIRLPALADGLSPDGKTEQPDILNRTLDAPLWPERYAFALISRRNCCSSVMLVLLLPRNGESVFY